VWGPVGLVLSAVMGFFPDDRLASALEFAFLLVGGTAIVLADLDALRRRVGALAPASRLNASHPEV
jgi:hypothetical protein